MCFERIPCSDDDIDFKQHLTKVHSSVVHLKELVKMSKEVGEKEVRKDWSLENIIEEENDRKETKTRKKDELFY